MANSFLTYNKNQLINLNYSLNKELLRTSRNGGYSSSTIIGCNTRKYHGLLVVPQELIDGERHVLLSNVDETLIMNQAEFHLSSRIFKDGYIHPKGHKYLRDFSSEPNLKLTYRIGKTLFHKEYIFVYNESRLLLRYELEDSMADEVIFRIAPLLAFRNIHALSHSNLWVNNRYTPVENGVCWQMYEGYSKLYFQLSKPGEYVHSPDWHYGIEYPKEKSRGYEYQEDLFVPGFFDIRLNVGEAVVISVGLEEKKPAGYKRSFQSELKKRFIRNSFENCLNNAAEQFVIRTKNRLDIIAGYHWHPVRARDTFISLPGISLARDNEPDFQAVIKAMASDIKNYLSDSPGQREKQLFEPADSFFWFFRTLHKYHNMTGKGPEIWVKYGKLVKDILVAIKRGQIDQISLHDNGLVWTGEQGKTCSWMDVTVNGIPVVPRKGYLVELNALWFDALNFFLEMAEANEDGGFIRKWVDLPVTLGKSFRQKFWDEKKGYLADYVDERGPNWDIRPNMIFAVSEKYSPLKDYQQDYVLKFVKEELLTRRGIRTLSPENKDYKGKYKGNIKERELAAHQGTAWPWLLGPFAEAYLKLHPNSGRNFIRKHYESFEEEVKNKGIGSVSEVFDGDPPFEARGAISHAMTIGELLRIKWMLENTDKLN